ncbi:exodeoxyribonuclease VII small subunit [Propionibacterium sp.]|uniref:exodeoxyribonuclease VII small subunit n=1 Tax=Propionibacterium sp. TaxID=1977903 RepID=UPI0039E9AA03
MSEPTNSGPITGEQPDLHQLSYEQARAELADVVQRLESGGVPLAESMQLWQRGEELAKICQGWLDGAKATIDQARQTQSAAAAPGGNDAAAQDS